MPSTIGALVAVYFDQQVSRVNHANAPAPSVEQTELLAVGIGACRLERTADVDRVDRAADQVADLKQLARAPEHAKPRTVVAKHTGSPAG